MATTKQDALPEASNGRAEESTLSRLECLLRELTCASESQFGEEIEKSLVARIDAYQRAVIKSVEVLCANALVNSHDIERLNRVIASLPGQEPESGALRRILANIENHSGDAGLSRREIGVLAQLLQGKSNREISEALGISDKTVEKHIQAIFSRWHVSSRTGIVNRVLTPLPSTEGQLA